MADYLVQHGRGWKFKKAVPGDVRDMLSGRKHWIETLGSIGYQDALAQARDRGVACDKLIMRLRKFTPSERQEFIAAGGLDGLKIASNDKLAVFGDFLGRLEPNPRDPEDQQALDALEAARARQSAAKIRADCASASATDPAAARSAPIRALLPTHGALV